MINRIANIGYCIHASFDPDPIPVHFLNTIKPEARLAHHFFTNVIFTSPKQNILITYVDKVRDSLSWFYIGDDLFHPNIRFCAHWTIQKF